MIHTDDGERADKALKLREQYGMTYAAIAERLGVRPANISGMLQRAKQRRERARESVE